MKTIDDAKFKPISIFGYVISTLGVVGLGMAPTIFLADEEFPQPAWFIVVGVIQILAFLIGGVGIIMRKPWAFYMLKLILYWLLIAFPIGTFISVKMLRYMKKNNVKSFFYA